VDVSNNVELCRRFLIFLLFITTTLEDIFFETSGIFLLKKKQLSNSMKINETMNGLLTPLFLYFLKEFMSSYFFFCRQLAIFYKTCSKKLILSERYVNWGALPEKLTRRAYKIFEIYDRFLTNVQFNHKF
jgi:hypothetical protein